MLTLRLLLLLSPLVLVFVVAPSVLADGEAALVIDWGDGNVSTHCVGFEGESIDGDELLSRAGYNVNGNALVCAIGNVGCGPGSSCLCECEDGGEDCTYWAFFTRPAGAGAWQYSFRGFSQESVGQGDMHGWRWGQGQSGRAQPPPNIAFESVCAPPPPTATPVPPTATPPPSTPTPPPVATSPSDTPAPSPSPSATPGTATPSATVSASTTPSATSPAPVTTVPPSVTPTLEIGAGPTPGNDDAGGGGGTSTAAIVGFVAVATLLVVGIVGGLVWRQRHGS